MSWWGTHPKMSREAARALLPPGACRLCVYRVQLGMPPPPATGPRPWYCSRCGQERPRRVVCICRACAAEEHPLVGSIAKYTEELTFVKGHWAEACAQCGRAFEPSEQAFHYWKLDWTRP